jgi:hypothetical protein
LVWACPGPFYHINLGLSNGFSALCYFSSDASVDIWLWCSSYKKCVAKVETPAKAVDESPVLAADAIATESPAVSVAVDTPQQSSGSCAQLAVSPPPPPESLFVEPTKPEGKPHLQTPSTSSLPIETSSASAKQSKREVTLGSHCISVSHF